MQKTHEGGYTVFLEENYKIWHSNKRFVILHKWTVSRDGGLSWGLRVIGQA
jgi:hypothetical protein